MTRTKLPSVKSLRAKLWGLCKEITRAKYKRPDGTWTCYTCDAVITDPQSAHTGHLIPRSVGGISLYYNLNQLRIQCPNCNLWYGGNSAIFMRRLMAEIGEKKVDELIAMKRKIVKADRIFFQNLIDEYEALTN